jgi:hypothetical protein
MTSNVVILFAVGWSLPDVFLLAVPVSDLVNLGKYSLFRLKMSDIIPNVHNKKHHADLEKSRIVVIIKPQ